MKLEISILNHETLNLHVISSQLTNKNMVKPLMNKYKHLKFLQKTVIFKNFNGFRYQYIFLGNSESPVDIEQQVEEIKDFFHRNTFDTCSTKTHLT